MQAIGFHAVLKKVSLQENSEGVIMNGRTVYEVQSIGEELSKNESLAKATNVIIKSGAEGDPIMKNGETYYIVHIDYIMAYDD